MMQAEKNYSTYAHELGHALNLGHTFDSKNGGLDLPAEGQPLENIMDYFKTSVDTDKTNW